jgi:RNA polymerase sigma factor (sigma-70 family)
MLDSDILKKLFYYCLKRTGNREIAEDLSGDISLEILTMLNRGYKPENFNAWLWTVAKAKYAVWVKNKKMLYDNIIVGSVSSISNKSSDENIEYDLIKNEELLLLRRELAIMSKDYREITVAYYIENKKISDIAKQVNLPEGTIKRKLSESRKYLKEGINMTRTYGTRSYAPENIYFHCVKSGSSNECSCPACASYALTRNINENIPENLFSKLSKNILLETYGNPCSTEDLSVTLQPSLNFFGLPVDISFAISIPTIKSRSVLKRKNQTASSGDISPAVDLLFGNMFFHFSRPDLNISSMTEYASDLTYSSLPVR